MKYDPILLAIPAFLLTMIVEGIVLFRSRTGRGYDPADTAASLSMGIGFLVIDAAWKGGQVAILAWVWNHRLFEIGSGPLAWAFAILAWDFAYYWEHRAGHEIRILWASHVNHHSSRRYNLSTALRQPWIQVLGLFFFAPLPLFGLSPEVVILSATVNLLYQYWIHTETIDRLPRIFEWILNTPSHHRVHHGVNAPYIDRNYGGILILWDRMFGTFAEESEKVVYGLTKNIETFNPLRIAFHEFQAIGRDLAAARSWRARAGYLFRYPGWQPQAAAVERGVALS